MKKKILILGVGNAQMDALSWCRERGMEVHALSYRDEGPGRALAHHFAVIDIRDAGKVTDYARQEGIEAVYSVGSDIAMPTVGAVAEALGLTVLTSHKAAHTCQHKHLVRQAMGPAFPGNIPYREVRGPDDLGDFDDFPCMVKPVDSQGQRGVAKAHNRRELLAALGAALGHSPSGTAIVERYVEGPELSVNLYLVNGRVVFFCPSDRAVYAGYPGGLVAGHTMPSQTASPAALTNMHAMCETLMAGLGLVNGPAYVQLKLEGDIPRLIEVTPRLDGCHIWRLIKMRSGIDLLEAAFTHLLEGGVEEAWFTPRQAERNLRLRFFSQEPGTTMDRAGHDPAAALHVAWYYEDGQVVRPLNGHFEKVGYCIEEW